MSWIHRALNIFRSNRLSHDIDRELQFHIAERVDALTAAGMSEADARQLALRQFGNRTAQREDTRDADLAGWVQSVVGDLRYAARALLHSPAFTLVAVLSLGLGIGANTSVYTLIDALVLRTLPVPRPNELLQISPDSSRQGGYFTNPLWEQVRDRQDVFVAVAGFSSRSYDLASNGEARRIRGTIVSGDYFKTFGVRPAIGRLIVRDDDVRGCPGIAVLGYRYWAGAYGSDPQVVGRQINLTGHPFEIVGVAAKEFRGPDVGNEPDVYTPICTEALGDPGVLDHRSRWYLQAIGRLKDGVTQPMAAARMAAIARPTYAETVPPNYSKAGQDDYRARSLYVRPADRGMSFLRSSYSTALYALMAGVGVVLLIACANVANLLLSRSEVRQRELAIRMAIGAGRRRLVRQLLTESLLLAVAGAGVGMVVAHWATQGLIGLIDSGNPIEAISLDVTLNWRLLAFTTALATTTVLLFGLMPAWRATRVDAQTAMKAQGRGLVQGHSRWNLGKLLVVAQVALSLVLVVAAGLFAGTFRSLTTLDPGFSSNGVLLVGVDLSRADVSDSASGPILDELLRRARTLPGVVGAAEAEITPVSRSVWNEQLVIDGFSPKGEDDAVSWFNQVTAGYFTTLETRLLAGRDFDASDTPASGRVAIVNDAFGRHFFGNGSPLGRVFRTTIGDTASAPVTIIGVVENASYRTLRETNEPIAYLAASQARTSRSTTLVLRTAHDPLLLKRPVSDMVRDIRSGITLDFTPLSRQLAESLQRERMLAVLSTLFGALALLLATLGLYGVMAYAVARRRGELGVRIALGAGRRRVVTMVLGEVTLVLAAGLTAGVAAAALAGTLVKTFLFDVTPTSPGVFLMAAAVLSVAALSAGLVPAMRAAGVDPIDALREQ